MAEDTQYFGIYRKLWSSAVRGRRINAVTPFAEFCFWRAHMIADDYGIFPADPDQFIAHALPKRRKDICADQIATSLSELNELVKFYDAEDEHYGIIIDFTLLQPAGKNGRRISRYPLPTWWVDPGESKKIQENPKKSKKIQSVHMVEQDHNHKQDHNQHQAQGGVGGGGGVEKFVKELPSDADSPIRHLIHRIGGRQSKREELTGFLESTAQVLTLWADVSADDTVKHPVSVMASRAASGGLAELKPLTASQVYAAVKAGVVYTINGKPVTKEIVGHNSDGLHINGELAVPSAQLAEAVYA